MGPRRSSVRAVRRRARSVLAPLQAWMINFIPMLDRQVTLYRCWTADGDHSQVCRRIRHDYPAVEAAMDARLMSELAERREAPDRTSCAPALPGDGDAIG
jgi:hypothetical protein